MNYPPFELSNPSSFTTIADGPVRHAYIHVPYCIYKCRYCAFFSAAIGKGAHDFGPFVDALCTQIRAEHPTRTDTTLKTVYLGGGTPSCLPTASIAHILDEISGVYGISPSAEVTLEMNPGTLSTQNFADLSTSGVNRLSIGVQSLNDDLLKRLGRIHTCQDVIQTIQAAQVAGIHNLSCDVMLGLEHQTWADVEATLSTLIQLDVPHISFYSLIVEPDTPLFDDVKKKAVILPDENEERVMYRKAFEYLAKHGRPPYEIANSSKPGFHSRHNLSYWAGAAYYGWGPGASGYINRTRYTMKPQTDEYIEGWRNADDEKRKALYEFEDVISDDEQMSEYIIFGLRRISGISVEEARELLARPILDHHLIELKKFVDQGLLYQPKEGTFAYTERGLDLADQVARAFV